MEMDSESILKYPKFYTQDCGIVDKHTRGIMCITEVGHYYVRGMHEATKYKSHYGKCTAEVLHVSNTLILATRVGILVNQMSSSMVSAP